MFLDAYNRYSSAQAVAASGASTNVLDHGSDRNIGIGEPMDVIVFVTTIPVATTGDETYTVKVQTDDDEAFGTVTDVTPEYSIPRGSAVGTNYVIPIPPNIATKRYTRLYYTLGGNADNAMGVTAYLQPRSMAVNLPQVFYPDAITIS